MQGPLDTSCTWLDRRPLEYSLVGSPRVPFTLHALWQGINCSATRSVGAGAQALPVVICSLSALSFLSLTSTPVQPTHSPTIHAPCR